MSDGRQLQLLGLQGVVLELKLSKMMASGPVRRMIPQLRIKNRS